MSAHFVAPGAIHECSMCPIETYAAWGELATQGWRSHYAGGKVEAIKLCPDCKAVIDARREAAEKARLEALLEAA